MATPNKNFCSKCGAPLSPGVRFCEACGQPIAPDEPPVSQSTTRSSKRQKKTGRNILIGILVLIICIILGVIAFVLLTGQPLTIKFPAAKSEATPTLPNTTTADLTNVSLKTEDLPTGFHQFTENEIKTMGVDLSTIVKSFANGATLVKTDMYGKDPNTVAVLIDALFYPMSPEIIGKMDTGFSNPTTLTQSMKGSQIIPNLSGIGDGSVGVSFTSQGTNANLLMIRRNNTLILLLEMYQTKTSNFDLRAIGQKMDQYVLAEYDSQKSLVPQTKQSTLETTHPTQTASGLTPTLISPTVNSSNKNVLLNYSPQWYVDATDQYVTDITQQGSWAIGVKQPKVMVAVIPPQPPDNVGQIETVSAKISTQAAGQSAGVLCMVQDINNYYQVEIKDKSFAIVKVLNGKRIPLTNPEWKTSQFIGSNGLQGWTDISVTCNQYGIGLAINGTEEVPLIPDPDNSFTKGPVALFASSADISSKGYYGYAWFSNFKTTLKVTGVMATSATDEVQFIKETKSTDKLFMTNCGTYKITFSVTITHPEKVVSVYIFTRLWDRVGKGLSSWDTGHVMNPRGNGNYDVTLTGLSIPNTNGFQSTIIYYQFVAKDKNGNRIATDVFKDVQFDKCS